MFAIVISEKGGAERREAFDREEITVGRVQGNDLMLPKGNVSKRHARLIFRDGRFIVTDLNSTNGTYVNRRRISQATIVREGDRVYIGDFVLRIDPPEADSAAHIQENTGSGPVPAPEGTSEGSVATHLPPARDLDEASGTSFPEPPRVPSRPSFASSPSDSVPPPADRASILDVSHADIDARSLAPSGEPSREIALGRRGLAMLVEHTVGAIGADKLGMEPSEMLRAQVERVLAEHAEALRSAPELEGAIDPVRLVPHARAEVLELGPLGALLVDSSVSGIALPRFDQVYAMRGAELGAVEPPFSSPASVARIVHRLARAAGDPVREGETTVVRRLRDGSRLTAVLSRAAAHGPIVSIARPTRAPASLEELVRAGTVSRAMATLLSHAVFSRAGILLVGPRGDGLVGMATALAGVTSAAPIVVVERSDELGVALPSAGVLRIGGDIDAERAILSAAQIPGVRLIADVTEPVIASATLDAVASGLEGLLAVASAQHARCALQRLAAAAMSNATSAASARELVASSLDLVVEIGRLRDGRHRVLRIAEVVGATADEVALQDVFTFVVERTAAGGAVEGTFAGSGVVPRLAARAAARGFPLDSSLFSRPPSR